MLRYRVEFIMNNNYCTSECFGSRLEAENWAETTLDNIGECESWRVQMRTSDNVWFDDDDAGWLINADAIMEDLIQAIDTGIISVDPSTMGSRIHV